MSAVFSNPVAADVINDADSTTSQSRQELAANKACTAAPHREISVDEEENKMHLETILRREKDAEDSFASNVALRKQMAAYNSTPNVADIAKESAMTLKNGLQDVAKQAGEVLAKAVHSSSSEARAEAKAPLIVLLADMEHQSRDHWEELELTERTRLVTELSSTSKQATTVSEAAKIPSEQAMAKALESQRANEDLRKKVIQYNIMTKIASEAITANAHAAWDLTKETVVGVKDTIAATAHDAAQAVQHSTAKTLVSVKRTAEAVKEKLGAEHDIAKETQLKLQELKLQAEELEAQKRFEAANTETVKAADSKREADRLRSKIAAFNVHSEIAGVAATEIKNKAVSGVASTTKSVAQSIADGATHVWETVTGLSTSE